MMKGQKGITLVALIITIIVMLILVAVTISVAMNGGLFTRARDAREQTIEQQAKEAITLAKAELLADFYAEDITAPEAMGTAEGTIQSRVQQYLDENSYEVTNVTGGNWYYTVTVTASGSNGQTVTDVIDLTKVATK